MLQEGSRVIDDIGSTWDRNPSLDWRTVDRTLRGIARRRAALDVEEARWLYEAERLQIWRPLGMVSAIDYLERVLGYTPHVAKERLRVARALRELPALTGAFARGELAFSAVRELTRVATPETETRWRDAAAGKNVREIEDLVAASAAVTSPTLSTLRPLRRRARTWCGSSSAPRCSHACARSVPRSPASAARSSTTMSWSRRCAMRCSTARRTRAPNRPAARSSRSP
jgi:hypothetical protein